MIGRISVLGNIGTKTIKKIIEYVDNSKNSLIQVLTGLTSEVDGAVSEVFHLVQLGMLTQLETEIFNSLGIGLLLDSLGTRLRGCVEPEEDLKGVVIPLKGSPNYGYLFLGFIKIN